MNDILSWLGQYSPPIVGLLVVGAALVYVLKLVTEKAVSTQFDRYTTALELRLRSRSEFEQKVLLDRYQLVAELAQRLGRVTTDLNRARHGTEVTGLFKDGDIVPLTSILEDLAVKRFLLTERFHSLFWKQAQTVLALANAHDEATIDKLNADYVGGLDEFTRAVNTDFGIDTITWSET